MFESAAMARAGSADRGRERPEERGTSGILLRRIEDQMAESEAPEAGRRLHVTVLLVASRRSLDNALEELGFAEDDDRIIEHDGKLAFLTCTHDDDCDDLYALISELSSRGESWELQSRIDTEAGRAVYQRPGGPRGVEAVDAAVEEEPEPEVGEAAAHDVENSEGLQALRRALRRGEPAEAFATIRPGRDGRVTARVLRRGSRRLIAAATAADEATL